MVIRSCLSMLVCLLCTTVPVFHGLARAAELNRPLDPVVLEGRAPRKVDPCHAEAYREQGPFCRTGPGCDGLGD